MKIKNDIRNLYTPVQPTVTQKGDAVTYWEISPAAELLPYIYCYWELKTQQPLEEEFKYTVVADGCIDIFFEASEAHKNFVMGFCKKYTEFPIGNNFQYIGIRFLPTIFPKLFNINAAELTNRFLPLNDLIPDVSKYITDQFYKNINREKIKILLDDCFKKLIKNISFEEDVRFQEALDIILKNYGVVQIEKDISTGLSPRQLRRKFQYYLGTSPKSFGKVVRFQNILRAKPSSQSLRQNKLFFDVGYYDQAHFIKEFKNFYGVTPTRAFGR